MCFKPMNTHANYLVAGLLGCCALSARAQTTLAPDATAQQLVESIGPGNLPLTSATSRNATSLVQNGSSNAATIDQRNTTSQLNEAYIVQAGAANALDLEQVGGANRASYTQTGTANQTTLSQRGVANQLDGSLVGNQNELTLRQQGNNNQLTSTVATDGRKFEVLQLGNNNSFTQRESASSTATQGYSVEQRGSNMRLTIEQGRVLP